VTTEAYVSTSDVAVMSWDRSRLSACAATVAAVTTRVVGGPTRREVLFCTRTGQSTAH
jgi:hypothetical protein